MIELKLINIYTNGELLAPDEVNRFKQRLAAFVQAELKSTAKPVVYLSYQQPDEN